MLDAGGEATGVAAVLNRVVRSWCGGLVVLDAGGEATGVAAVLNRAVRSWCGGVVVLDAGGEGGLVRHQK
jgi:hypothetical protein